MKKTILTLMIAAGFGLAFTAGQMGGKKSGAYKLVGKSDLSWNAMMADKSHGHNGTVAITAGEMIYDGETFKSGKFTVDMKSMKSELTKETGADNLYGHVGSADFFNYLAIPNCEVAITKIENGTASATLSLVGKTLQTSFPVTLTKEKAGITLKGNFTVDFSSLGIPGFTPNDENKYVSPKIDFGLNVMLATKGKKK